MLTAISRSAAWKQNVVIDRDTAARLGITPQQIDAVLYDAFGQEQISTIYQTLNQYHVVLEVAPQYQKTPDALQSVYVITNGGAQVPLSAFAHFEPSTTSLSVNHQGQFPAVTLSFNLAPGGDPVRRRAPSIRPSGICGMPASIHGSFQGTAAGVPGLALVGADPDPGGADCRLHRAGHSVRELYPSHHDSVDAALGGHWARSWRCCCSTCSWTSSRLIGIILLIGIVKKNAIMMIDFALEVERTGKTAEESIYEAGAGALPAHHDDHGCRAARRSATGFRRRRGLGDCAARWASPSSAA